MNKIVSIFLFCLISLSSFGQKSYPLTGRVMDHSGVLSSQDIRTLKQFLSAHEDSTSNQIVVYIISSLKGRPIEEFSLQLAEQWELGQAGKDNGVLLLIAIDDREMRIEVGTGLEGALPDIVAGQIIHNEIAPSFRTGEYNDGVLYGVTAIVAAIDGEYLADDISPVHGDEPPMEMRVIFGIMFLGIPTIFAFVGIFSKGLIKVFLFLFLSPFYLVGSFIAFWSLSGMITVYSVFAGAYIIGSIYTKVKGIDNKGFSSGSSSGGSSSWSSGSSSSSFSSGSSFSGGGGGFSGGGSSGGW